MLEVQDILSKSSVPPLSSYHHDRLEELKKLKQDANTLLMLRS